MDKKPFNAVQYNREFNEKAYDRFPVYVRKGNKEKLKEIAAAKGKSVNRYILDLIQQDCGIDLQEKE